MKRGYRKMDKRIEEINNLGCDTDEAMKRMLNDEEFYIECLNGIIEDENFDKLKSSIENHEIEDAFDAAHTLKGVLANLGLTNMYNIVYDVVESLRVGNDENLLPRVDEVNKMKSQLKEILSE